MRPQASSATTEAATSGGDALEPEQPRLPATYRSLVARSVGASFREVATIIEAPLEPPGEGQVLVRVTHAGINGGCETFRARGEYAFAGNKGKTNFRLGAEGAGVVAAVGPGVTELKVGQTVTVVSAGYSEYALTSPALCFPVAEASAAAVAVSLSGLTAAAALLHTGEIRAGQTVLVTAAAGGTGHFGAQVALLQGCRVVATCGGPEKAARLRELGCHRVIDYKEEDVGAVLASEFQGQIDVAYEGVGGALRDAVLANLSPNGRCLAVGYISEYPHAGGSSGKASADAKPHSWELPPADKLMWEGLTLRNGGQTLYGQVWPQDRAKVAEAKRWIFEQFEAGRIQAWVDPKPWKGLEAVVPATDYMLSGASIGKVVAEI